MNKSTLCLRYTDGQGEKSYIHDNTQVAAALRGLASAVYFKDPKLYRNVTREYGGVIERFFEGSAKKFENFIGEVRKSFHDTVGGKKDVLGLIPDEIKLYDGTFVKINGFENFIEQETNPGEIRRFMSVNFAEERNLKQFFDIGVNELKNAIPKAEMLYEKDELDYDGYFPNLFNKIGNYIFAMSVKNNKPKKEVEAKE